MIVAGLDARQLAVCQEFRRPPFSYSVVVVCQNLNDPLLQAVYDTGALVVFGDPSRSSTLLQANMLHCESVICANQHDAVNVQIATQVIVLQRKYVSV